MKHLLLKSLLLSALFIANLSAENVIWSGNISADGTPSPAIDLSLDKKYQIVVSGTVNLGKWVEAGVPLGEDASFNFDGPQGPEHQLIFRNSSDIALESKKYNPEHIYKSQPFIPKNSRIHFWVDDKDYGDNSGALKVQIIEVQ